MVYNWGHVNTKDNEKLDKEFKLLQKQISNVKKPSAIEKHVTEFLWKYKRIGEDPTDTVIRDKVWEKLRRLTTRKLTEQQLDDIWNRTLNSQNTYCSIQ